MLCNIIKDRELIKINQDTQEKLTRRYIENQSNRVSDKANTQGFQVGHQSATTTKRAETPLFSKEQIEQ